jgi:hypothetical protein
LTTLGCLLAVAHPDRGEDVDADVGVVAAGGCECVGFEVVDECGGVLGEPGDGG